MKLLLIIPIPVWLFFSAGFFTIGEYLSKRWALHPSPGSAAITVVAYALGSLAWLPVILQKNQLAVMGTIWLLLALVSTVGVGTLIFHERLTTAQWLGVILAFGALGLLGG